MNEFYPFFLIIFAGVFFSVIFRRIHVPWVVGLILGGILIGPHALNILSITPTMEFIAQIGLIFLMFMAGLESRFTYFQGFQKKLLWISFVNGALPFFIGVGITLFLGYGWLSALLVGIVFISSSIAMVIPSLERYNILHTRLGQVVVMKSIIQDIGSLILLSIVLQNVDPVTPLPLYIFYPLVVLVLILLRLLLPLVHKFFTRSVAGTEDFFQQEFRAVFLILVGTVIAFELLGLHPIIAGFFAGLVLSGSITSDILKDKIRTISYGIFIPTFFVLIGLQTDITVFINGNNAITLILLIVGGSIISKFVSGWFGGVTSGFNKNESLLIGISSVPQLSTTLAVAFTGLSLGFIDQKLITAMIALSVVTVVVSPILMSVLGNKIQKAALGQSGG